MQQRKIRRAAVESLEARQCLSSVGWDGPGRGSAELTYYIGDGPEYLDRIEIERAIESALDAWSDAVDVTFTETSTPNQHDSIDFEFRRIDGPNSTLAQAYFPDDVNGSRIAGDVQFDTSELWEVGNSQGGAAFDLTLVAAHEIGHSLGIDHIHHAGAVLNASVSAHAMFDQLSPDDIDAALSLYAPPPSNDLISLAVDDLPKDNSITISNDDDEPANDTPFTNVSYYWWVRWSWRSFHNPWTRIGWHRHWATSADTVAANNQRVAASHDADRQFRAFRECQRFELE